MSAQRRHKPPLEKVRGQFKVGSIRRLEGGRHKYRTVEAENDTFICRDCDLRFIEWCDVRQCRKEYRSDGKNVVFKRISAYTADGKRKEY